MTETAFTLWILAAMFLGIVMGLILAHIIYRRGRLASRTPFSYLMEAAVTYIQPTAAPPTETTWRVSR
jgi:Na+/H+-dicarboxylate symporter